MSLMDHKYVPAKLYNAKGDITKSWYVYFAVLNPVTGKMHQLKKRGQINYIKTVRERTREGNYLVRMINGMLATGQLNPFPDLIEKPSFTLIQELEAEYKRMEGRSKADRPTLTHETCIVYKSALKIFTDWMKKSNLTYLQPLQFTKQHAISYSDFMIQEKKYSGVTYNARKIYLGTFFNALLEREIITVNYFAKLKTLPETPARITPFTDKELQRIKSHLNKINKPELLLFFNFILYVLMRGRGITKIQLFDITDLWVVLIYGDKGKTKLRYAPTIPKFMWPQLKKLKKKYPGEYYLFGEGLKPGPVPLTVAHVRKLFRKYVKQPLGIDKNMYWGKHSGITKAYKSGMSIRGIQGQAGHTTEQQTRDYLKEHGLMVNEEFKNMK